jgi:hypothetical protein
MRKDIYVVQNNAEEGKQLKEWCEENGLPISKTIFGFDPVWNIFCWYDTLKGGFIANQSVKIDKTNLTQVTIEEFKALQLKSLGKINADLTPKSEELYILPDEGCFYGTPEQQTAFAKFLCTRPFCRADAKITKDEAIGIGWNKTSHWWLKTKNSQKQEYNFQQLRSFIKVLEEPQFEKGKWYKINNNWWAKFETIHGSGTYWRGSEKITALETYIKDSSTLENWKDSNFLLADLNEIQKYLPDGHVDKIVSTIKQLKEEDFIKGKWYKDTKHHEVRYCKFDYLKDGYVYFTDFIYPNGKRYEKYNGNWGFRNNFIEVDVLKIQQWLPDNHVDKISEPVTGVIELTKEESIVAVKYLEGLGFSYSAEQLWRSGHRFLHVYYTPKKQFQFLTIKANSSYKDLTKEEVGLEQVPEYVECISLPSGWGTYTKVGTIYKTDSYPNGGYKILFEDGGAQTCVGKEKYFKPSTKEAFDNQFKPKYEYEVVHCKTQEEWDFVTKTLGYVWVGGSWSVNKENSCINIKEKAHASKEGTVYGNGQAKILSFEEWCNKEGITMNVQTNKEWLLEEARKRYPIGTKFKCIPGVNNDHIMVSEVEPYFYSLYEDSIAVKSNQGVVYKYGVWAEIINESSRNSICFGNMNLEEWLRETKKLNLSLPELEKQISLTPTCNFDMVYLKLKGIESTEKAEILWNEWNKPDAVSFGTKFHTLLEEKLISDFEEKYYPSMSETPKFTPSTAIIIPVKQKQIFKN